MTEVIKNRDDHENGHGHINPFYINGEIYETSVHKLTVREILEMGGFAPAENYRLTRENGNKTYTEMNQEVPVHKDERFIATYGGTTPVSEVGGCYDE